MKAKPVRILIAEDEAAHVEAIGRAFRMMGRAADLQCVGTLKEYRERAGAQPPDIAVLDLNLPDGRALEVLTSPPEEGPFPILIMTSYGNERTAVAALKAGALDYMVKSFATFSELPHTVERALREWELIRERKRMIEALQERENQVNTVLDSVHACILLIDPATHVIVRANRMAAALCNSTMELMSGRKCFQYVCPDEEGKCPIADLHQILDKSERVLLAGDGRKIPVMKTAGMVKIGNRDYILETLVDITDRKRMEEERLAMERRLFHSQKLESLGILAGGIAHDFNNLLLAVLGNLGLALEELSPLSSVRLNVEDAVSAARRAADLTRQLLAYSGQGRFIVRSIDLSELVEENVHMLKAAVSKTMSLNLQLDKDLPPIQADAGQLQQVIMNLITNASEAIGNRAGIVRLSTGVMECDEDYLRHSRLVEKPPAGCFAWLEVEDTGCGMDAEVQQKLFDPFFTTKFTGRGLGMSAVLGILRGHQGAILVDSAPGKGTTIRVLFPIRETDLAMRRPSPDSPAGTKSGGEKAACSGTILVADDEEIVRRLCIKGLSRLGFQVIAAVDGADAVRLFREHANEVAVVVMDLSMPRMDGVQTFDALLEIRPDVKVVLSSGFNEEEATRRFGRPGLKGFIEKPYTIQDLETILHKAMKRGR